jgi:hypothetical protein
VIAELTGKSKPLFSTAVHINGRCRKEIQNDKLRREKLFEHVPAPE